MKLQEFIKKTEERKIAIGHFNISEFTALRAIVRAVKELNLPVVIGTSEGEAGFIGIRQVAALIKSIREESGQPIFLNADHFRDLEKVKEAVVAGYDSIIFDAAHLSLGENIKKTKEAVLYVKSVNPEILVEGELGYIGTSSEILARLPQGAAATEEMMTQSREAKQFVEETKVDLLAPAVGNIHGMLKNMPNPQLNIERIKEIKEVLRRSLGQAVPLVLHGGSGISDDDFLRAIDAGVSIIHINTEIRLAWRQGLEQSLRAKPDEIAPYKLLPAAEETIYKIVLQRLKLFNGIP